MDLVLKLVQKGAKLRVGANLVFARKHGMEALDAGGLGESFSAAVFFAGDHKDRPYTSVRTHLQIVTHQR